MLLPDNFNWEKDRLSGNESSKFLEIMNSDPGKNLPSMKEKLNKASDAVDSFENFDVGQINNLNGSNLTYQRN